MATYRESNFDMTWDQARRALDGLVGDDAATVLSMYRYEDTAATPFIVHARIITDMTFRRGAHTMAERKAAQSAAGGAPVWTYLWTTPSPAFGGRYGATHGVDVSPSMHDVRFPLCGQSAESLRLADQMESVWTAMTATGNPNNPRLPRWPMFDTIRRATMVFGDPTNAVDDPRSAIREYWVRRDVATKEARFEGS